MSAPPGWYPAPGADPRVLQYWDGRQWTSHRAPATFPPAPAPPLAPSGLRRVDALFGESWAVIRRAGWSVAGAGLVLWGLWSVEVLVLAAIIDFEAWSRLLGDLFEADQEYQSGIPPLVAEGFEQRAADLAAAVGPVDFTAAGLLLAVGTLAVSAAQVAAVYRISAEAAAGRPAGLAAAWQGVRDGAFRLAGYGLLAVLAIMGAWAVMVGLIAFTNRWQPISAVVAAVGFVAWVAAFLWLVGRFSPAFVQACLPQGSGALRWAWRATRGRTLAVLGRTLLWSMVASTAVSMLTSVLLVPLIVVFVAAVLVTGTFGWLALLVVLAAIAVSGALNGYTLIGAVPIWRDLTADPDYRSIGPDSAPARP